MSRIFVTGMGIISAIGHSLEDNRRSLREGFCGITNQLNFFPSRYSGLLSFACVTLSNQELQVLLNAHEPGLTRTSLLALHAFNQALAQSGLTQEEIRSSETALIGASTVGGMCLTDELYHDANTKETGSPFLSSYDNASVTIYLQERSAIGGIVNTINTACSSSANSIMYGANLLKTGLAKRAIVGGADSLAKFTINGFHALHILSPGECKPFDESRNGLNLGEGAAFLVLEREEDLNGKKVYAELTGYCNTNDAYHPSSLSDEGDGPYLAMQGALSRAGLVPGDISFINAHGTGTENNDLVESVAMKRLFETPPPFSSTKSNTGHTLGAAGSVEAVFSILNLVDQEVYPGLRCENPIAATGLMPVKEYKKMKMDHVMSNSFGFGGNCSSLIFSKA